MLRATIVVPTIREVQISEFLAVWKDQFVGHRVIIVEDNPERSFDLSSASVEHYSWKEIDQELGHDSWIIPRRSDCIRSFGFFKASQSETECVITLDDDCVPIENDFVEQHLKMLASSPASLAWTSTVEGVVPRGVPYFSTSRRQVCVLNHGLWEGVPDYDAITALYMNRAKSPLKLFDQVIPRGTYFPMCGMNLSFSSILFPAMYFLLMGKGWPFDRFGDIWSGIFMKRICDHLGYCTTSGRPFIQHQRASSVWANLQKEGPGYELNETFWQIIDATILTGTTVSQCYRELAVAVSNIPGDYWSRLGAAMTTWVDLIADRGTRGRLSQAASA